MAYKSKNKKSAYMIVTIPQKGSRAKKRSASYAQTPKGLKGKMKTVSMLKSKKHTQVVFKLGKNNRFKKMKTLNKKR